MTLTRRMAHARIELHKKSSFNDVNCLNIFRKPFSHFCGSRQFDTFSVDMFDTFTGTRQFDTFSVGMFDTFSVAFLTHLAALTHLAELTHLAVLHTYINNKY